MIDRLLVEDMKLEDIILDELRKHGPSRGAELVAAISDLDGYEVPAVVDALARLAVDGRAAVRFLVGRDGADARRSEPLPYWVATETP